MNVREPRRAREIGPTDPRGAIAAALFAALVILFAMGVETQRIASLDGYRRADLGAPLVGRLYAPWASWQWMQRYDTQIDTSGLLRGRAPRALSRPREAGWSRAAFRAERSRAPIELAVGFFVFVVIAIRLTKRLPTSMSHGRARFATASDIHRSPFARETVGVVLAQDPASKRLLIYRGEANVLALGPPGTGKSSGIVIPTLLRTWPSSAIVFDPAAELAEKTRFARENVIIFDPRSETTARFNPLDGVPPTNIDEIRTVLASYFIDDKAHENAHFVDSALEVGVALFARSLERDLQLGRKNGGLAGATAYYYAGGFKNDVEFFESFLISNVPYVVDTGSKYAKMEERQRSSVVGTLTRFLTVFRSDDVARATSSSDFSAADLRSRSTTLYITVRERDAAALNPVMRMILTRLFDDLTLRLPTAAEQSVLLLLDEFPLLRAPVIAQKLGTFRKYRVHPVLLAQTLTQIVDYYGVNEVITGLCDVRVYYPSLDERTQESASKACGETTQWGRKYIERRRASLAVLARSGTPASSPVGTGDARRPRSPIDEGSAAYQGGPGARARGCAISSATKDIAEALDVGGDARDCATCHLLVPVRYRRSCDVSSARFRRRRTRIARFRTGRRRARKARTERGSLGVRPVSARSDDTCARDRGAPRPRSFASSLTETPSAVRRIAMWRRHKHCATRRSRRDDHCTAAYESRGSRRRPVPHGSELGRTGAIRARHPGCDRGAPIARLACDRRQRRRDRTFRDVEAARTSRRSGDARDCGIKKRCNRERVFRSWNAGFRRDP